MGSVDRTSDYMERVDVTLGCARRMNSEKGSRLDCALHNSDSSISLFAHTAAPSVFVVVIVVAVVVVIAIRFGVDFGRLAF